MKTKLAQDRADKLDIRGTSGETAGIKLIEGGNKAFSRYVKNTKMIEKVLSEKKMNDENEYIFKIISILNPQQKKVVASFAFSVSKGEDALRLFLRNLLAEETSHDDLAGVNQSEKLATTAVACEITQPNNMYNDQSAAIHHSSGYLRDASIKVLCPQVYNLNDDIRALYVEKIDSILRGLNDDQREDIRTMVETEGLTANGLAYLRLRSRFAVLKMHYIDVTPWLAMRGYNTPEAFRSWLDIVMPDREKLRLVFSDLSHIDIPAYRQFRKWMTGEKFDVAPEDFGLPAGARPLPENVAVPTGKDIFDALHRGDRASASMLGRIRLRANRAHP